MTEATCTRCVDGRVERVVPSAGGGWVVASVPCDHLIECRASLVEPDEERVLALESELAEIRRVVTKMLVRSSRDRDDLSWWSVASADVLALAKLIGVKL